MRAVLDLTTLVEKELDALLFGSKGVGPSLGWIEDA